MILQHGSEITVEQAIRHFPDLLNEKVKIVEASAFVNPGVVVFQFIGDHNHRTGVLKKPEELEVPG